LAIGNWPVISSQTLVIGGRVWRFPHAEQAGSEMGGAAYAPAQDKGVAELR